MDELRRVKKKWFSSLSSLIPRFVMLFSTWYASKVIETCDFEQVLYIILLLFSSFQAFDSLFSYFYRSLFFCLHWWKKENQFLPQVKTPPTWLLLTLIMVQLLLPLNCMGIITSNDLLQWNVSLSLRTNWSTLRRNLIK